jgi:hypothetical protein
MSEEIVYSNLTSKSSCPVGYYTVNIGGTDRCCLTPDCSGYGFGVNPRSGGSNLFSSRSRNRKKKKNRR